jgi:CheY-like chemotaxis protein
VFEPFFTTKPQGQGTGLGLAQVYGFIKQSGGQVNVYSEPGQGTTVKLYLPRAQAAEATPAAATPGNPAIRDRSERILVVEDEAGVRDFCAEVLTDAGYRVITAETPDQALAMFRDTPGIEMLFTDVVLGAGMTGRQLSDEIRRQNPEVIVLFTTGYTRDAIIHQGRLNEGINFIGKPFAAASLVEKIDQLFERVTAGTFEPSAESRNS